MVGRGRSRGRRGPSAEPSAELGFHGPPLAPLAPLGISNKPQGRIQAQPPHKQSALPSAAADPTARPPAAAGAQKLVP